MLFLAFRTVIPSVDSHFVVKTYVRRDQTSGLIAAATTTRPPRSVPRLPSA